MKNIFNIIIFILLANTAFSQSFPNTFNYQAVARDIEGKAVSNAQITVEATIWKGSGCETNTGGCTNIWQELHFPTTNDYGLFSINIGSGQTTFEGTETDFDSIDWSDFTGGNYFLQIRVDFGNSLYVNGLINMGTVKFQSVPYTLSAQTSQISEDLVRTGGKVPISITDLDDVTLAGLTNNQVLSWNGTNWVNATVSASGPISLDDLTDVTAPSPSSSEVLYYNGTGWVNSNLALSDISDFSISSPVSGQALVWNGTNWVNQNVTAVWSEDASYVYYSGGKNIGIGTTSPVTGFQMVLTADLGFMVNGTFNVTGTVPISGAGTRMMFFPSKSAFRAGTVDGTQWDNANIGNYSAAFGRNNIAVNTYSVAFGYNNQANGVASAAFGTTNKAAGLNSLVAGTNNNQTMGVDADNSIVAGNGNDNFAENNFMVGTSNDAYGTNSIVFGETSRTDANGTGSISGGYTTNAQANYSQAFGVGNTACSYAEMVIGRYNTIGAYTLNSWVSTEPVFVVGNGTGPTARNNALLITKSGNILIEGTLSQSQVNPSKAQQITNFSDILKINAVYENRNGQKIYGLNSDEVKIFFPDLISEFNNQNAINYIGIIPLMLETIKQQNTEILNLKSENEFLKKQLEEFDQRLKNLEEK